MKCFLALSLLFSAVLAAPGDILSKRVLQDHEWKRDYKTGGGCPAYLQKGQYESPSYITHVSKSHPNQKFGRQHTGLFTPNDIASIFSFDVPASRADANCTLEFLFPKHKALAYHGKGSFFFTGYNPGSCPGKDTTYNNQPAPGPFPPFPPIHMEPGHAYTIDVGPCFVGAGKCVAGMTSTNDTLFAYLQDTHDCPIGIYTSYSYGLPCEAPYC
ncbi:GPI anchored cell wall protein [Xylariaceae sp. FL0016]|nr:GPI anchored cell wall protein [Xylariaceae sp. FL0016]